MSAAIPGSASRDPLRLCPCIRAKYVDLVTEAKAAGITLAVIETSRDAARQAHYRRIGVSRTLKSLHLPQPPHGLSLAFDVAPKDYLRLKGWFPGGPLWLSLGKLGCALGLEWGGNWSGWKDYPHFQLRQCGCAPANGGIA